MTKKEQMLVISKLRRIPSLLDNASSPSTLSDSYDADKNTLKKINTEIEKTFKSSDVLISSEF